MIWKSVLPYFDDNGSNLDSWSRNRRKSFIEVRSFGKSDAVSLDRQVKSSLADTLVEESSTRGHASRVRTDALVWRTRNSETTTIFRLLELLMCQRPKIWIYLFEIFSCSTPEIRDNLGKVFDWARIIPAYGNSYQSKPFAADIIFHYYPSLQMTDFRIVFIRQLLTNQKTS